MGDRHRLRIACKNLRYNVELYGELCGRKNRDAFLKKLKPVQDSLGWLVSLGSTADDETLAPSVTWLGLAAALAVRRDDGWRVTYPQ